ncbi:MAG: hypothetical protein LBQ66_10610 [Planctomycetaceae bacterium]|jgi:hypothetical protein|nr:hypothetical protein [Planctomycetaceae bacterium]
MILLIYSSESRDAMQRRNALRLYIKHEASPREPVIIKFISPVRAEAKHVAACALTGLEYMATSVHGAMPRANACRPFGANNINH